MNNFGELLLLSIALSMDAFAVSVCKGLAMKKADLGAAFSMKRKRGISVFALMGGVRLPVFA